MIESGEAVARLQIFRHAPVLIDPDIPSADWSIASHVEQSVLDFATQRVVSKPERIVSSQQRKAVETAKILASQYGCGVEIREGFEEHHRENERFIKSDDDFRTKLKQFFDEPDRLVFGSETARDALARFQRAVFALMSEGNGDELLVTHGTVMSLFLASEEEHPFQIWQSLSTPDCRVVEWSSEVR